MEEFSEKNKGDLEKVWNGAYQELYHFKKRILGKLLTIIDATIVEPRQNKSIKDIITQTIWEDDSAEKMTAAWLIWFEENNDIIKSLDRAGSEPVVYQNIPISGLKNYK